MNRTLIITISLCVLIGNLKAQDMNSLNDKQQKVVAIAANTAIGNLDVLKTELNAGLDAGLTVNQVNEVLVQMYAYCGFPRSLQGINTFMAVMNDRRAKGIDDNMGENASPITDTRNKYVRGKENLEKLTGVHETTLSGANAFAPAIDTFLKEHLFADIFERDVLTFQEREIATISVLAAMEGVEPMLRTHINMGRNTGLSEIQLNEIVSVAEQAGAKYRATFALGGRGTSEWFTGEVHVQGLVNPDEMENLYSVGQVTFSPGGRTHWHTHPIGQTLLVLEGKGWYQERGKPAQLLTKGSVVAIPKDVEHWHGASADTKLVHIAISNVANGSAVTWMTPVTDEEYAEVNNQNIDNMSNAEQKDYTFELSDNVTRTKVTFKNRYGISLTGDLYMPKKQNNELLPAIAVSGPFGAVKEQASGLYAQTMAERGFVTLAFDPSYTGESGGEPRHVASPDINTEDFSAAVDFLGIQKRVDRNRIGIVGICGFGGFALNASAVDKRIKAVVTTSMYDMSRVNARGYFDNTTPEQRSQLLEQLGEQRWKDAENGAPTLAPNGLPNKIEGNEPQFVKDYFDYYKTDRGFHPRSINSNGSWTATNALSFMNMPILTYIKDVYPRPMLLIAGENAHSRYFSEDAYKAASEPKELMIIPNAAHVDLYDNIALIPFNKLEVFFNQHLK